jgi:hypothetical protein
MKESEVDTGHVAHMGEGRKLYRVLVGNPEGKTPLRRPRRRWEDGTRMDLREIGWEGVQWIQMAQYRDWWQALVNTVIRTFGFWRHRAITAENSN